MLNISLNLFYAILLALGFSSNDNASDYSNQKNLAQADTLRNAASWPADLIVKNFAGPDLTPSPACLAVAASGEVFVGVDKIGSLGKTPGKGSIMKLIDENNDGQVDKYTQFAQVDNPRGIIASDDKVYVLHTVFSKESGLATGMNLVVFQDQNKDGLADGPSKPLIEHISSPAFLQSRGTDHATNGIRMGIDGWIYIAVGDFGFYEAVDRSGTKITMHGGGIVRVRPDGTEFEVYTHGMRNVYDVAIDPYMNIFTRDNTNDGGGWNIRFSHQIQSGEYGYPLLFKNFTEEIIPALADLGGGSGTGALFMDDPNWPENYNQVPMMADWGRNWLFIHRLTPDAGSFQQKEEEFIKLAQITDLDIDGSGRLYLSAWDGAGYSGSPAKGFIIRAIPKDWTYKAFPDLKKSSVKKLSALLKSESAVVRLSAQQELIQRPAGPAAAAAWKIAADKKLALFGRVAGIFTYAQISGESGMANLQKLTTEPAVREFALRALADRKIYQKNVPLEPFIKAIEDPNPRVQLAGIVGLGRLNRKEAVQALLSVKVPATFKAPEKGKEGPHFTPNSALLPAHVAVRALVSLDAVEELVKAIGTKNSTTALWALRYMHDPKAVSGLISAYNTSADQDLKTQVIQTLARLYKKEAPFEGLIWWSTRPDGHGPYYNPVSWESSPAIKNFLVQEMNKKGFYGTQFFKDLNSKYQLQINELGTEEVLASQEELVDLEKIRNKKGQIGKSSIEDVMLAMAKIKGNPAMGAALYVKQGCQACHTINKNEPLKGPFMGQIGSIMNREQIAESILKPDASISQGFATVSISTKAKKNYTGFVTAESADQITLRNIAGQVTTIKKSDVASRKEMETSMMPAGMANALSYEEFASLITYLSQQK